ncbi:hypothetical protein I3843_04G080200 [Carya illinoinensis]|nr:hypothetical protein I3843_04G080200 [Carya illinoinensis]
MGRRRRSMEFISNDKSRMITYHKRKKGLEKKLYELSTLCGIKACMIIYGPRRNGHPCDMATWPENDEDCVRTLVNKFKSNTSSARKRGTQDLSDYFIDRKKNIDKEISRKRMENCRSNMFRTWDERMDYFSYEQLRIAQGFLDTKIEAVQRKIDMLKAADNNSYAMNIDAALEITGNSNVFGSIPSDFPNYTDQGMIQRINVGLDQASDLLPMPKSCVKSLDDHNGLQWPDFYSSYDQGDHSSLLPFCINPLADPMKVVKVDEACSSHGNMSISTMIQYSPPSYPIYYDLTVGLMENISVNNSLLPPMFNYNPSMQLIPPINVQNPMMQTNLPDDQMHGPPADMNSIYT